MTTAGWGSGCTVDVASVSDLLKQPPESYTIYSLHFVELAHTSESSAMTGKQNINICWTNIIECLQQLRHHNWVLTMNLLYININSGIIFPESYHTLIPVCNWYQFSTVVNALPKLVHTCHPHILSWCSWVGAYHLGHQLSSSKTDF